MENDNKDKSFSYTYSSKEQEEVRKIREKYVHKEEDKIEQLRRLDESVTKKGTILSIIIGVIGTLILGVGMCCTMVWTDELFVPGIIIGVLGIGVVAVAFPIYSYITKKERERIAPEIIRLTDELMK